MLEKIGRYVPFLARQVGPPHAEVISIGAVNILHSSDPKEREKAVSTGFVADIPTLNPGLVPYRILVGDSIVLPTYKLDTAQLTIITTRDGKSLSDSNPFRRKQLGSLVGYIKIDKKMISETDLSYTRAPWEIYQDEEMRRVVSLTESAMISLEDEHYILGTSYAFNKDFTALSHVSGKGVSIRFAPGE